MKISSLVKLLCGQAHNWVRVVCLVLLLICSRYLATGVTVVVAGILVFSFDSFCFCGDIRCKWLVLD